MNDDLTHCAASAYAAHTIIYPYRWLAARVGGGSAFPETVQNADLFSTKQEALLELRRRRNEMAEIVVEAVQSGCADAAAEVCVLLWPYWYFSGYIGLVFWTHETVLCAAATGRVSRWRLARLHAQLCVTYRSAGKLSAARWHVDLAVDLARGSLPQVEATALEADGDVSREKGDLIRAEARFASAEWLAQTVDSRALLIAKRKRAAVLLDLPNSDLKEIEHLLRGAWSICIPGEQYNRARLHTEFGRLWGRHGNISAACAQFDEAIRLHGADGHNQRVAENRQLRAEFACRGALEDFKAAAGHYVEAGMNEKAHAAQGSAETLGSIT